MNPLHTLAIRGLASLDVPRKANKASKQKLRTAVIVTLSAAGVEADGIGARATVEYGDEFHEHSVIAWYDVSGDALRLFAPSAAAIDDTSRSALELLNGNVHLDLHALPIEDLDAVARVLALFSADEDARTLHARLIEPHRARYDDELVAPEVDDLEELWGKWFRYYIGGSNTRPSEITPWIERAYAFGTGPLPAPVKPRTKAKAQPKTKKRR